ncbi:MAG: S41 family peptidase, partial [Chitinophagales bacterium]
MFNKSKYSFLFLILLFTASSCEKVFFEEDFASISPFETFEYLWKECDEKYSYFELKNIDWDAVKEEYAAKLYEDMSEDSLFSVLGGMLTELQDDHTNLISDFNVSNFGVQYLGQDNFDWRIIVDNYITQDYYITGPFSHNFLDNGEVGYVRFPAFSGIVDADNLDFVLNRYKDTKGLIIDLRENGGGRTTDIFNILSRLVDTETLVYYSRIKNGVGHDDFSEAEPVYVTPHK